MNRKLVKSAVALLVIGLTSATNNNVLGQLRDSLNAKCYTEGAYTLCIENNASDFNPITEKRLKETFFKTYPRLAKEFNPQTAKTVIFRIDTAYDGVAAAARNVVVFNPGWFKSNPEDIDVVTHEGMHIVQNYGRSVGPWWLTEGIADYVREVYGVNNAAAKWSLHSPRPNEKYDNGYRITGRFLLWIEKHVKKGFVKTLDAALRDHTYTADIWEQQTGKTNDALWEAYVNNPKIPQ